MKKTILTALATIMCFVSCKKEKVDVSIETSPPKEIITKLKNAGFETSEGLRKFNNGYIVEYDIFLTEDEINNLSIEQTISKNAKTEHYRTNNIVRSTPRTITVYMDPSFGTYMQNAFDQALARYNNAGISLTFVRSTSTNADIKIMAFYESSNTLGISGGFPTNGNPANTIQLNTYYYNNNTTRTDAVTTIAHEIGHAIGFRHTDFMNRSISCGGSSVNEGDANVGANLIPGTPSSPSANSWMLACSNNTDRPFTQEDLVSLRTVYVNLIGTKRTISSVAFSNVFMRLDGINVFGPNGNGSGTVNCQYLAGNHEQFIFIPQNDGTYAIASTAFPNVYLRMDGTGVTSPNGNGGGRVNCNYGVGPWEKFKIKKQSDGKYTIESAAFPNVFLRIDGSGVTSSNGNGGGKVNCNYGFGSWEKFTISPAL